MLIHGTAADHSRWAPIVPALQRHFTVYAMDRRGRGGSGDAAAYRMDDEFADVAAVTAVIDGGPVDVVGHSYGGICAMESVFRNASIARKSRIESQANDKSPHLRKVHGRTGRHLPCIRGKH